MTAARDGMAALRPASARAFLAVLSRDVRVTLAELPLFLANVILQPLFLLFIFGRVLGALGYTDPAYDDLLFPGLLALATVITGMQTLAIPLVAEFGWSREIEDRLLAPMPTALVAAEKVIFAAGRALVAALVMIPVGILVLGSVPWRWGNVPLFLVVIVLGAVLGANLGLVIGTAVPPARINIFFSLIFTPLVFTGSSQYPWPSLSKLPWFQVLTALNPMTYVSEGLRGAMVPDVAHIRPGLCVVVLAVANAGLLAVGVRGFFRRAID